MFAVTLGCPHTVHAPMPGGASELPCTLVRGCCQPGTLAPSLLAAGAWQEPGEGGAGWDDSVLLSPAQITQKVIVS